MSIDVSFPDCSHHHPSLPVVDWVYTSPSPVARRDIPFNQLTGTVPSELGTLTLVTSL